jgi:phosphoribosylanthranilate isomerase
MWIKICGNTNLDDAALAVELGADALGFVFAASPRRVTPEQVAAITPHLPATVERIGVFDTDALDEIVATVRTAGLTGVQVHRGYSPGLIASLAARLPGVRLIQTSHWNVDADQLAEASRDASEAAIALLRTDSHIQAVLVDSRTAVASGGTGVAFDWDAARGMLAGLAPMPLVVAGGLTPGNVREAITVLDPWGVDVASGVEARPGVKDPVKLAAFIANSRNSAA